VIASYASFNAKQSPIEGPVERNFPEFIRNLGF
jgi:hypothetical protein